MRRIFAFFLSVLLSLVEALGLLSFPAAFAHAQSAAHAEIASIDAHAFPQITALMDVYDPDGRFITGLQHDNVTVNEDGEARPLDKLTESPLPVQLVVAVNPGPGLAVRDATGVQRFTRAVDAMSQWVNALPSDSGDDLSLVSLSGSLITHSTAKDWFVSLDSFKPDFRNTTPNLQTFSIALDTAAATTPQPGMKRAILFITPHMDDPDIDNSVKQLIQRAIESKVRVLVWFIDGESYFPSPSANAFKSLALQTNGSYFAFSGKEVFPDLSADLAPLRHIYALTYTSSLTKGGDHAVSIDVKSSQGTIHAVDQSFSVDIQPPNPILVSPPLQIKRQPPADDPYAQELIPAKQKIEILIEFPDDHPRPLKRTTLYVDGQPVAQNISKPFEVFTWDLTAYEKSGQHEITVEAEDVLGLKKSSIATPVTLTVTQPPRGIQALLGRYSSYLVLGAIGIAGLALLVILIMGIWGGELFKKRREKRKRFEDPLTQPVVATIEPPTAPIKKAKATSQRARWLQPQPKGPRVPQAPAYLRRLVNGGEPASALPIPLLEKEMTFGTDPVQCKHVLDDPSISPLHARIKQVPDGSFLIYDHGSVAGTWVNYEPITREGHRLAHGDRIHFGQLMYRFDLSQPPTEAEPKVISKKSL